MPVVDPYVPDNILQLSGLGVGPQPPTVGSRLTVTCTATNVGSRVLFDAGLPGYPYINRSATIAGVVTNQAGVVIQALTTQKVTLQGSLEVSGMAPGSYVGVRLYANGPLPTSVGGSLINVYVGDALSFQNVQVGGAYGGGSGVLFTSLSVPAPSQPPTTPPPSSGGGGGGTATPGGSPLTNPTPSTPSTTEDALLLGGALLVGWLIFGKRH